ncbi:alcohol dehydrogenase [Mycena olivaceomarginata]|nr:alcohol dehydrogenase [Mycena olivaceomarginata]
MAPIPNARVLFNSIPESYPVPGETTVYDTTQTLDLETVPLNGGFLVKTLVLSVDPYFRGRMAPAEKKSYIPSFQIGAPLDGFGISQEYTVFPDLGALQIIEKHPGLPWTVYLGAAGMPGGTAFVGWKEHADAKQGEVAFVTAGAGNIQSWLETRNRLVIQLAKESGLKVIASAGSEEKVEFMKSIGADVAFNYKTTDTRAVLFWDNVGGDTLDAAIEFAAFNGRFIECGSISGYNTGHSAIKNWNLINPKCLHIHGILIFTLFPKYAEEFYATIPAKLASGEFKYTEDVGDVILAVQKGTNKAKAVVVVAEE